MKIIYDKKFKKAAINQVNKSVEYMMNENPGKAYKTMKKIRARLGNCQSPGDFNVISHQNKNLSLEESTNSISQQYQLLNIARLPHHVQDIPKKEINIQYIPIIQPYQVHKKMREKKQEDAFICTR